MDFIKNRIGIFSFLFIVITMLILSSCSIGGHYFFANNSNNTIILVQHFKDFNKNISYNESSNPITVLQEIKDPELTIYGMTNSDKKFNKRIHKHLEPVPIQIDSVNQIVEITIPSKKAIRFDSHHNLNYHFSKKIQVKINDQIFDLDDLKLKYKTRGFGFIATRVIKYKG